MGIEHQRYWLGRVATPYIFSAPAMSLFFLLMLFPMAMVFRYSVQDGAILKPNPEFVGIANFLTLFSDPVFVQSIGNTLYFTVMSVAFHLLIGLLFALMLNSDRVNGTLRAILRVLFILPWLFTAVIIAIVWRLILDPNGVINGYLIALNIIDHKIEWFSSTATAIHALTFVNIWAGYPLYMVSLLAGFRAFPRNSMRRPAWMAQTAPTSFGSSRCRSSFRSSSASRSWTSSGRCRSSRWSG